MSAKSETFAQRVKVFWDTLRRAGNKLKNGEGKGLMDEMPNAKQEKIESRNKGKDYYARLVPNTSKLKKGEKGINE